MNTTTLDAQHAAPASGRLTRLYRYGRLTLHLLQGALTVALVFPFARGDTRRSLRQAWSRCLLAILGVQLAHHGGPPVPGSLLVSNHISWLDIFVLNAIAPAAFISKAEVRQWPLIGWLAARNETVFLRRGSRGHARLINGEIAALLQAGRHVALFPEGTTTDGSHVLHFHAALLQPALEAGRPVQPVALRYLDARGRPTASPAYHGDVSLGECLRAIIATPTITASLTVLPPLDTTTAERRAIARQAHERIVTACALPG